MPRELTVGTVNIAGAMRLLKNENSNSRAGKINCLAKVVGKYNPDFLGVQEVICIPDAGRNDLETFRNGLENEKDKFASVFSPTLNSIDHSHPRKWTTPNFEEYFSAGQKIYQGLGMLVRCGVNINAVNPWNKDGGKIRRPLNIGGTMPAQSVYLGNRDTEPRCLTLTRVNVNGKNVLLGSTQLSTLREEDAAENLRKLRRPTSNSVNLRTEQIRWIVNCIKSYQKGMGVEDPIVLLGDFNCEPDAKELNGLSDLGLVHAHLGEQDNWAEKSGWTQSPEQPHTHRLRHNSNGKILIDHVFVSARTFKVKEAHIINTDALDDKGENGMVSDHNPVVVKLEF